MRDKKEILLTPAKSYMGLSEDERLEVGRLMLKAGYRVEPERRREPLSFTSCWINRKEASNA